TDNEIAIDLYDLRGKRLLQILPSTYQAKGTYTTTLDTNQLNTGMYLLVFRMGNQMKTRKLSVGR
ncbi:MAG: T9SS type A sorting domain-containing protein, partial [Bacteroidota bacterium]